MYKKLQPEIISSFYNQVSNGSVKKIQFEPYYSWIEFDKLESLKDARGDEQKQVESEWRTFVSKTLETAESQIDFTNSDGVMIIFDPNSSYLRQSYAILMNLQSTEKDIKCCYVRAFICSSRPQISLSGNS